MAESESPLKLPTLLKLKHGDTQKRSVSFADTQKKGVSFAETRKKGVSFVNNLVEEEDSLALDTIKEGDSEKTDSGGVCRLYETDSPELKELKAKANQAYLEYSLFAGTHTPATQALAALSWHRYVRSKEAIRADLNKSLDRCKTFFGNVGIPFRYNIGDVDFKRRELREGWKERRATGIISTDTEQEAFALDSRPLVDTDDCNEMHMADMVSENKKIARRGNMTSMINGFQTRMVTRIQGLTEMEIWINKIIAGMATIEILPDLDQMIEDSFNEFTNARYDTKAIVKQMRRLIRKMTEKHRMLQNRMKVTSKLKERAAMANKNIKVDYTNMTTINSCFEMIINRQLVFLTLTKKLSREAQENDEKLRKIQLHMTKCVKELSDDKEVLFHKNHLLSNETNKQQDRIKLQEEEIEFYQNKEGLIKHQANVEAAKNLEVVQRELTEMTSRCETVSREEEALRDEVQDLHEQVLRYEVEQGDIRRELAEQVDQVKTLEELLNDEKRVVSQLNENIGKMEEENQALRVANDTKPDVSHKAISMQSLESLPRSVTTPETPLIPDAEIVYVDRTVENYDIGLDTEDLKGEMELVSDKNTQTDSVEFAEDKRKGLTNPFETDLMAGNMQFLNAVGTKKKGGNDEESKPKAVPRGSRVVDTPGYTQMIVKRLKEERENDISRLADYIKRERGRTEATSRKLNTEHKRAMRTMRREIKAILISILRYRDKFVGKFSKYGIKMEGMSRPTVAEVKNDRSEKTTVSLKHMAGEILNTVDYNTVIGLREIQFKIKESLANQKTTEKELLLKNKKLERTNKTMESMDSIMTSLKRDGERLRLREQYTNERYRELLKREEELERAEEAHVTRIEQKLSEMWTKSATDIEDGLDEILTVQKKTTITDNRLRRASRPPKLRKVFTTESFTTDNSTIVTSTKSLDVVESEGEYASSDEDEEEEEEEQEEEEDRVVEERYREEEGGEEEEILDNTPATEGQSLLQASREAGGTGIPLVNSNQIPQMSSEWSQGKSEEMRQYMEDIQTIKPSTITHPGETHLLHYDSSVAKIDEMYQAITLGNAAPRRRRRANVNATDTTVLHYNSGPVAKMELTVRAADQMWNLSVLRNAYENKAVGIRVYSNSLDLIRRNLAIKEVRFAMLAGRLCKVKNLAAAQAMLTDEPEPEESGLSRDEVDEVVLKLADLHTKHATAHFDKLHKLTRLNTFILAEQVRVFQQVRDCDLAMNLRFPYPVLETGAVILDQSVPRGPRIQHRESRNRGSNRVKVSYPAPLDPVLRTSAVKSKARRPTKPRTSTWKNPTLTGSGRGSYSQMGCEAVPYSLVLECNSMKSTQTVTQPAKALNPHITVPPIPVPTTLERKKDPSRFTLPTVGAYFSQDSGLGGSNVVLDPLGYM